MKHSENELTAVVASLSLGGAERLVLDWAARIYPQWRVHLIVIFDYSQEWPVPDFVRLTRLHGRNVIEQLDLLGRKVAISKIPVCITHLLRRIWRTPLAMHGAHVVPVIHNSHDGWEEDPNELHGSAIVIGVSAACADDLRAYGWSGAISVIRHIPPRWNFEAGLRARYRAEWRIPLDATVIGMIGAVKPQKCYLRAVGIFNAFVRQHNSYLVIIGGPVNADHGRHAWVELVQEVERLSLAHRVILPGFIPGAAACLPAFDVLLNTSDFEGISIATLEALVNNKPVVGTKVGGQGELSCPSLKLLATDAPVHEWVSQLQDCLSNTFEAPSWSDFPSHRLWTLTALARPIVPSGQVLFVTQDLNCGGAQRSLVNLAQALRGRLQFRIAIAGSSTTQYFWDELKQHAITVDLLSNDGEVFSQAENLVKTICDEQIGTVCFWNLDPKVKLLTVKTLAFTNIRFVDVAPGNSCFAAMDRIDNFAHLVTFTKYDFYKRLDTLVLKYNGTVPPAFTNQKQVIRNGVTCPTTLKTDYTIQKAPRIVISGRIATAKYVLELIAAMHYVWKCLPEAELHVFGGPGQNAAGYFEEVLNAARDELDHRIYLHGLNFDVKERLHIYDLAIVLGSEQGCPNSLLEALATGLPTIANDDGGTREQIVHEQTGLLVEDCRPTTIAKSIVKLLTDRVLAERLGKAGLAFVSELFTIQTMTSEYLSLFHSPGTRAATTSAPPRLRLADFCQSMPLYEDAQRQLYCTIVTSDHLDKALALFLSLSVLVKPAMLVILAIEPLPTILVPGVLVIDLAEIREEDPMADFIAEKYYAKKDLLRWSLKPILLRYLLNQLRGAAVLYCDSDVAFFEPPTSLFKCLETGGVVLTPHWRPPHPINGTAKNFRLNFLDGLFNSGCVGANDRGLAAIAWWADVCATACEKNYNEGLYHDQRYLDLLPIYFEDTVISRNRGINLADWNIHLRQPDRITQSRQVPDQWPVIMVHFTNNTIRRIESGGDPVLEPFFARYLGFLKRACALSGRGFDVSNYGVSDQLETTR